MNVLICEDCHRATYVTGVTNHTAEIVYRFPDYRHEIRGEHITHIHLKKLE